MPDAIQVNPPQPMQNPLDTINGILGIQQKQQALQTGQYAQQTASAGADVAQRSNQNQALVQGYMSNPKNQGKSLDEMQGDLQNYGAEGQAAFQKIVEGRRLQTNLKSEVMDLNTKKRSLVAGALTPYSDPSNTSPNANLASSVDALANQDPELAGAAHWIKTSLNGMIPDPSTAKDPGTAASFAAARAKIIQGELATYTGKSGVTPGVRTQGTTATPIATSDVTGSQTTTGKPYDITSIGQTGTGQAAIVGPKGVSVLPDRTPPNAPPVNAAPRTAQDDAPGANAPKAVQENYQAASQAAQKHVEDVRKADEGYGNNVSIANTIRHLAPNADTGPGRQTLNSALAGLGVQSGSNNQELGAFLDRQAAGLRSQMGLPATNEGAEQSKSIAGNTGYALPALMDKNDYTQALVEGAHQYRHGLDRVAGFSGQASPKAVNEFKSAWADNFDPNVYKADLAKKQGKLSEFVNSLDPKEAATLAQKRKNLQSLSNGQIPQ